MFYDINNVLLGIVILYVKHINNIYRILFLLTRCVQHVFMCCIACVWCASVWDSSYHRLVGRTLPMGASTPTKTAQESRTCRPRSTNRWDITPLSTNIIIISHHIESFCLIYFYKLLELRSIYVYMGI